jgi:hypothetical protein
LAKGGGESDYWWSERVGRRLEFSEEDRTFVICLMKKEDEIRI